MHIRSAPIKPRLTAKRTQPSASLAASQPADQTTLSASAKGDWNLNSLLEATASEAASLESKLPEHAPGEVLVKLPAGSTPGEMAQLAQDYQAEVLHQFRIPESIKDDFNGEMLWLKLDGLKTAQGLAAMAHDDRIVYAASNDIRETPQPVAESEVELNEDPAPGRPNDLHKDLWAINNTGQTGGKAGADISALKAWETTTGSRNGPIIALLDTGVDYTHPDLKDNIWTNTGEIPDNGVDDDGNGVIDDVHGYDSVGDKGDPMDRNGHGTHCAGIIGATGNNGQGVVGANWEAQILPIKALGRGTVGARVRALLYATEQGATITSNSWGYTKTNVAEADIFKVSPQLHVCASGNARADNDKTGDFPSGLPDPRVVSVASSDDNDKLSRFSNYGAQSVDLAAPGSDILSTIPRGRYGKKSGTSMSTPYVAGVAGLIAARYPDASVADIKTRLLNSVDRSPAFEGKMVSGGRLNAARAVEVDEQAPTSLGELALNAGPNATVSLAWTAGADDPCPPDQQECHSESASRYSLRVSESPISDGQAQAGQVSFDAAPTLPTAWPAAPGTAEQMEVQVFPSGQDRTVHFALKSEDNVGNRSAMSANSVVVPAVPVAFEDSGESSENWEAVGFTQVSENGRSYWTDSPEGNYENKTKASLTSRVIDISGLAEPKVALEIRHDLERGHDKVYLEYSKVGEERPRWSKLKTFHGRQDQYTTTVDLPKVDDGQVKLRLRLDTDESVVGDGFFLDRFVVYSGEGK